MALSIPNTPTPRLEIFDSHDASTSLVLRVAAVNGFATSDIVGLGATIGADGIVASGQVNAAENAADRQWNTATLLAQARSSQGSAWLSSSCCVSAGCNSHVRLGHAALHARPLRHDARHRPLRRRVVGRRQGRRAGVEAERGPLRSLRLRRFRRKMENVSTSAASTVPRSG